MTCKTQYYMTRYLFWAVFWIAPVRDHEDITLDVDRFIYHMCDKLGLTFVWSLYLINVHVTSFLSFVCSTCQTPALAAVHCSV
jgi:hypothetical protein